MNDWSTGWSFVAIALVVRAAVSKDPWWARVLAVLLAVLSLISQSLALELRARYGEPETRTLFLILWEQTPYWSSVYMFGWSIFSRDPKAARLLCLFVAAVGLFPLLAFFLIVGLALLGAPIEMH
ncbi:MAG: hypothetical protein ACJ8FE_02665 [Sphingomicrobium sp.]